MSPKKQSRKLPYSTDLKERARKLRIQSTPAEKHFWNNLRKMPFYSSTTFNRQKPIGNYIVDFYCHQLQLVIEIDGDSHSESLAQINDTQRTVFLESQGLMVLRFTNREVKDNIEAVMVEIEKLIEKGKSPQPPS